MPAPVHLREREMESISALFNAMMTIRSRGVDHLSLDGEPGVRGRVWTWCGRLIEPPGEPSSPTWRRCKDCKAVLIHEEANNENNFWDRGRLSAERSAHRSAISSPSVTESQACPDRRTSRVSRRRGLSTETTTADWNRTT